MNITVRNCVIKFTSLILVLISGNSAAQIGEPYQISGPLVDFGNVANDYRVSPNNKTVVYRADQDDDEVDELYSVPITGGTPVKLNANLVANGNVNNFQISADSKRVVYIADQDIVNVYELYSVPIDGSTAPVQLNANLVSEDDEIDNRFQISSDSQHVIYILIENADSISELYSVPISGGTRVKLNADLTSGSGDEIDDFLITADSQRVLYTLYKDASDTTDLFSALITGATTAVKLNPNLMSGQEVGKFLISADSQRVVYRADLETLGLDELYSVPIAGGAPAVELRFNVDSTRSVSSSYQISADSQRVVYRADQDAQFVSELYSVPIIGGVTPVKLNGDLVADGLVQSYQISADSQRVIYGANQDNDTANELYSVPITGSTDAVKLNADLLHPSNPIFNGDVSSGYKISADSQRVVYRADQDSFNIEELYSVPIAGESPPIQLNTNPVFGGDVSSQFQISADSQRVIYLADQDEDSVDELYSVDIDGGTPVKLNADLPSGADVREFLLSPNGELVLYRADQNELGQTELFAHQLVEDQPLCLPIKISSGAIALICL